MARKKRRRFRDRDRKRGLRILQLYAEAAVENHPGMGKAELSEFILDDINTDFEERPILKLLLELFAQFLPILLDSLLGGLDAD